MIQPGEVYKADLDQAGPRWVDPNSGLTGV
jgi:hypothetical protein